MENSSYYILCYKIVTKLNAGSIVLDATEVHVNNCLKYILDIPYFTFNLELCITSRRRIKSMKIKVHTNDNTFTLIALTTLHFVLNSTNLFKPRINVVK